LSAFNQFGTAHGLPNTDNEAKNTKNTLSIHADEFNELIGDQFIPMINKAGGAGYQVTAYTPKHCQNTFKSIQYFLR
jgi:hypothetical protein